MKIETITYRRVKNLGNYQSETLEATASLEEEDHPETVADDLKALVYNQLYPPEPDPDKIPFESGETSKSADVSLGNF